MATRAGFHNATNFSKYPEAVSLAIRTIGKSFYVTRSFEHVDVGNSSYWGLLARPADEFSVHLNADRELLFIFATYETFEVRTLEAFDEFYCQLEQKRIDRSIRFLISSDTNIETKIQHYLQQNPEYPIIVPIYLPRLGGGNSEVLDAIRRNYLLRDLFGYQNPLREDTFFFGRQAQINEVLDLAKSGQSSSIFGLRKSGKTSTIYAITRRARAFDCTPVFIDCQSPVVHAKTYNELLTHVINEIRASIGQNKRLPQLVGPDADVAQEFENQLKTALGQAKSNILIIFDEIENISPGTAASDHWNEGRESLLFWQNLRSFIQRNSAGKLALCLVGTSPLLLELPSINEIANPMYLFTRKRFIPAFTFEETKEMIEQLGFFMGLEFEATQIAKLQKTYGGHPFFTRQVCSNINGIAGVNRPARVSDRQIDNAIEEFGGQLGQYLEDILDSLKQNYPDEFDLLRSVVRGDKSEISEYGKAAPELIDHLIGYGVVERRDQDVDIRFDAVRQALDKLFKSKNQDEMWTECMQRRNKIEIEIRKELFISSKRMSVEEWHAFLKSALTASRYEKLQSMEPRVLFSKSTSALYLTDLIAMLKHGDSLLHLGEQKSDILRAMQTVNDIGRNDSHAKEISELDFNKVSAAFVTLEDEFGLPS